MKRPDDEPLARGKRLAAEDAEMVEYGPVPRRTRELTRVETCKTQKCAGSAKREACFFSGGSRIKRQAVGRNDMVLRPD